MSLQYMLDAQNELQKVLTEEYPSEMTDYSKIMFMKDMYVALDDEMHELLGEIGWKPWATSRHINREAAVSELVDAWHFFMNFMLVLGVDEAELTLLYYQKRNKNIKRKKEGYDGVSTKCPVCKRAYDDEFVRCFPSTPNAGGYCAYTGDILA
jgi:hypothetical protein